MSLKSCIDANCKSCAYSDGEDGQWRAQVTDCNGKTCASYHVRPLIDGQKHEKIVSRRIALNAHCKSCIYDEEDSNAKGSWRAQVRDCKTTTCELWEMRPKPLSEGQTIKVKEVN